MEKFQHLLAIVAWASVCSFAAAGGGGAFECPCISNSSFVFASLQAELAAANRSVLYGMQGCKAYDENNSVVGCAENEESFCLNPWCYVDTELCPLSEDACEAAGGIVGGDASPHCRSRPSSPSAVVNSVSEYSYATCNSVNTYDTSSLNAPLAGKIIKVAVDAWAPWVVMRTHASGSQEYGGALYDFFREALLVFDPAVQVELVEGWATEASRAKFASSYTACVHDVAVGNFDLCVADLWRTPEREQISPFSTPLRQDHFYLVVPIEITEDTMLSRLQKPFAPFKGETWLAVVACVICMSLILCVMRLGSGGYCRKRRDADLRMCIVELGRSAAEVWDDLLQGAASAEAPSPALKFFRYGFQFFLVVIMASYTASLASLLVVQRQAVGAIEDIESALEQGIPICTPTALLPVLKSTYPAGIFIDSGYSESGPRMLYAGTCGAVVLPQGTIDSLHAGNIQKADCQAVADGTLTEEEASCSLGLASLPRNDCDLLRVGDILVSVPVAFPVSGRVAHSLSWALTRHASLGGFDEAIRLNADTFPVTKCEIEQSSEEDGLAIKDLAGTMMISGCILGVGVALLLCDVLVQAVKLRKDVDPQDVDPQDAEAEEG